MNSGLRRALAMFLQAQPGTIPMPRVDISVIDIDECIDLNYELGERRAIVSIEKDGISYTVFQHNGVRPSRWITGKYNIDNHHTFPKDLEDYLLGNTEYFIHI